MNFGDADPGTCPASDLAVDPEGEILGSLLARALAVQRFLSVGAGVTFRDGACESTI